MSRASIFLKIIFFIAVIFSIYTIYYSIVHKQDFEVFTNEDGPDTSDYFLIEETE
jgi:hypothetical protein